MTDISSRPPQDPRAQYAPQARVGTGFIVAYAAAYFGTWVALLPPVIVTLALRVSEVAPTTKEASLSLVLGVGAILALFANPFFGKLSDRTTSRLGMRRPWLLFGAIGGTVSLVIIATAGSIPLILLGWCLAQLSFNALLAAIIAVLPDQVPEAQRGSVSGVLGTCQALAIVAGVYLVQAFAGSIFLMFLAPGLLGLILVLIFVAVLRDRRLDPAQREPYSLREFASSFWVNPLRHRDFGWAWLGRFLLFMGLATLLTYQAFYLIDHLHRDPGEVAQLIFIGILVQTVFLVASSFASGWLSDRLNRRKIFVLASALIYGVGLAVIALAPDFSMFLVGMAITGVASGAYFAIDLALVADVLPNRETDAAKDLGIFNIANAMPQSLAPAIAPLFLAIGGGGNYTALFIGAAAFAIIGALAIQPIRGVR